MVMVDTMDSIIINKTNLKCVSSFASMTTFVT
jgi:hypothetical protein